MKMCAVFRAIGPLLSQNWDDENRPFEPARAYNQRILAFVSGIVNRRAIPPMMAVRAMALKHSDIE